MEFDRDPTTIDAVIKVIRDLPEEMGGLVSLREYDRYTRQVFIWCLPEFTEEYAQVLEQRLREQVYKRILVSRIIRRNGILPEYKR